MKKYFSVFHIMGKTQKFLMWAHQLHSYCGLNECDGACFNWAANWDGGAISGLLAHMTRWGQEGTHTPCNVLNVSHKDENASSVSIEATIHNFAITQLVSFLFIYLFIFVMGSICFTFFQTYAILKDIRIRFQLRLYWSVWLNTNLSDLKRSVAEQGTVFFGL